jgi:acyl-CoA thioester hydrolase
VFRTIGTRWMDNDVYGHVNNVVYYSWFDTAVNAHLIEAGRAGHPRRQVIGLVIETQCNYFAPLAFPQTVQAGLRVAHLGRPACATRWACLQKGSR